MPKLKIDLHVHTDHSDSVSSVDEVIDAARRRGLDGIALTDHETITTPTRELAADLIIIPGVEVETSEGHILVLALRILLQKVSALPRPLNMRGEREA